MIHIDSEEFILSKEDKDFTYQSKLTEQLDTKSGIDFNQAIINEIVLWKVNRYALLTEETLEVLNNMPDEFQEEYTRKILHLLLNEKNKGIRLPMASTILRFKNPSIYQIIDQRVYRLLYGEPLKLPTYNSEAAREKQVKMYLDYLGDLRNACTRFSIPFEEVDRDFYNADKRLNKGKRLANYGSGKG